MKTAAKTQTRARPEREGGRRGREKGTDGEEERAGEKGAEGERERKSTPRQPKNSLLRRKKERGGWRREAEKKRGKGE